MNLGVIDWTIVFVFLAFIFGIAIYANRYTKSVTGYLVADRCAGRYLLTLSDGMAALGAISVIANFEKFFNAGFAASWWGFMLGPIGMIIALSGWVVYRFRETRAMTMAQFFEMRYSRRFRIFSGILCFISGVVNYGVFPGITSKFLVYFCGFPTKTIVMGFECQTYMLIMAALLITAITLTLCGGFIAIMITDFIQGQLVYFTFLLMALFLLWNFSWSDISETLLKAPPGRSMLNPFDQTELNNFNVWFFLIFAFKIFYNCLGWQSNQSYNCAAKSPHEAKMSKILGSWRGQCTYLLYIIAPICAYVFLNSDLFAEQSGAVQTVLASISDEKLRSQMTVTQVLSAILPVGFIGLFCLSMLCAAISTDDTCLHSWGSILIQDVIMPFRKKPFSPKAHLVLLRLSVVWVAVFAFMWSWLFPIRDYIFMYFLLTGTIYLGGSGAVIIGGLYWKKATVQGAYTAMIAGCSTAIVGVTLQIIWDKFEFLTNIIDKFPLNGAYLALVSYIISITCFVGVSLATSKKPFNLNKMLNRNDKEENNRPKFKFSIAYMRDKLGINKEFTKGDKFIFGFQLCWTLFWFSLFVFGSIYYLLFGISDKIWAQYWKMQLIITICMASITMVWFFIGGMKDLRALLTHLKSAKLHIEDDGWEEHKKYEE